MKEREAIQNFEARLIMERCFQVLPSNPVKGIAGFFRPGRLSEVALICRVSIRIFSSFLIGLRSTNITRIDVFQAYRAGHVTVAFAYGLAKC